MASGRDTLDLAHTHDVVIELHPELMRALDAHVCSDGHIHIRLDHVGALCDSNVAARLTLDGERVQFAAEGDNISTREN